jgi:hypothetical protein
VADPGGNSYNAAYITGQLASSKFREKEKNMFKKFALSGSLVITAALALSAFSSAVFHQVSINLVNPVDPRPRLGYFWNGINIPSNNLSAAPLIWRQYEYRLDSPLVAPASTDLADPVGPESRGAYPWKGINISSVNLSGLPVVWRQYEYRPDFSVSGPALIWRQYEYRPDQPVTGFQTPPMSDFTPSRVVSGFQTPPMSDFVPSIAVTGFRTPPMSDFVPTIAGFVENLRLYELRYTAR